jgi:hypothetical protein
LGARGEGKSHASASLHHLEALKKIQIVKKNSQKILII